LLRCDVSELLDAVAVQERVWVRMTATLPEGTDAWSLGLLDLVSGSEPPNWAELHWHYERAILEATVFTGAQMVACLRDQRVDIGGVSVRLSALQPQAYGDRKGSGDPGMYRSALAWPRNEWTLTFGVSTNTASSDPLISGDAPSFVSLAIATAALLNVEASAGDRFEVSSGCFREQDLSGRIASVEIYPTETHVTLDGSQLPGMALELANNRPGPTLPITDETAPTIVMPTPDGLPAGAWVVLKKGSQWIDRRFLDYPYAREQSGVTYIVPPETLVETLIAGGEGPYVEFKTVEPGETLKVMKTIAAFANGDGGTVLIGVTNEGVVIGLEDDACNQAAQDALTNRIRNWVWPLPQFSVQRVDVPSEPVRSVLAIKVEAGLEPPYAAGTTADQLTYFVRRGATTFAVWPDEVRRLGQSRTATEPFGGLSGLFKDG
jgi:Putative DNA-binding domain